ncbi:MAG: MBL fold metallo-hydrolase [Chloroflexi bacterium]|nr:MBL fold metallo-hydrolase [Chloroflexota bacterium]
MLRDQELLATIESQEVKDGELAFWWLGQLSVLVKTSKHILVFDPYLAPSPMRNFPPPLAPEMITNADYIFGSHDHGDHIDRNTLPGMMSASPKARTVCSKVAARSVVAMGIDEARIVALDEGDVYEEDGLRITPVAVAHELLDHDPELGYPYLSFVVETDGVTICHTGDACLYDGYIKKLSGFDIDVIFLPINGRDAGRYSHNVMGNMTYQEAVDVVGALRPRLAVPGHYDLFTSNTADPFPFAGYLRAKYPDLKCWIGEHAETVFLSK